MNRAKGLTMLLASGVLAASIAGASTTIFAQEPSTTPTTPRSGAVGERGPRGLGHRHDGARDEQLAQELGVSVDRLRAARNAVEESELAAAVQAGRLTQAEADLIKARRAVEATIDRDAITAAAIGITEAELTAARQAGKSLQQLLQEEGVDAATYRAALERGYTEAVQRAVTSGTITQAQADQILSGGGLLGGRHGGFGGGRGGLRGGPRDGGTRPGVTPTPGAGA